MSLGENRLNPSPKDRCLLLSQAISNRHNEIGIAIILIDRDRRKAGTKQLLGLCRTLTGILAIVVEDSHAETTHVATLCLDRCRRHSRRGITVFAHLDLRSTLALCKLSAERINILCADRYHSHQRHNYQCDTFHLTLRLDPQIRSTSSVDNANLLRNFGRSISATKIFLRTGPTLTFASIVTLISSKLLLRTRLSTTIADSGS